MRRRDVIHNDTLTNVCSTKAEKAPPSKKRKTVAPPEEEAPVAADAGEDDPEGEFDANGDAEEDEEDEADTDDNADVDEPVKGKVGGAASVADVDGEIDELVAANGDEED